MFNRSVSLALALACLTSVTAQADDDKSVPNVSLDGYYRVRGLQLNNVDLEPSNTPNVERYFQHRLRLEPKVFVNENISASIQADALDDQIWGANPGNVLSQSTADRNANLIIKRAYGEVKTTFGVFRAGRMGSHWGKGLLSNDGDGFRNEFGDARGGDTYDRILFATKPLGKEGPLTTAILFDKIIETEFAAATSDARHKGDVDEFGLVLHYTTKLAGFDLTGGVYGIYRFQNKTDTYAYIPDIYLKASNDWFHFDFEGVMISGQTKGVTAFFVRDQEFLGTKLTKNAFELRQPTADISMIGAASEIGFKPVKMLDLALESGFASGDKPGTDAFGDADLTSFSFDPDYNVGLLMFEYANRVRTDAEMAAALRKFRTPSQERLGGKTLTEVCQISCANKTDYKTTSAALNDFLGSTVPAFVPTNGAVRNAFYLFPKVRVQPMDELKFIVGVLWAKAPEGIATRDSRDFLDNPKTDLIDEGDIGFNYGIEYDFGVNYDFTDNFHLGLQAGYFHPGNVFERALGNKKAPDMYAVQPRFTVTF